MIYAETLKLPEVLLNLDVQKRLFSYNTKKLFLNIKRFINPFNIIDLCYLFYIISKSRDINQIYVLRIDFF